MKEKPIKKILREVYLVIAILLVCVGLLFSVLKNYRQVQMTLKTIHYSVQGYPQGDVLLIGSSFMEYWTTSEADLGPLHTVNAAVAGTKVQNWKDNIENLVEPFHPSAIVFYMGTNDIDGSENSKSGEAVAKELEEFFDMVQELLPGTPIYYISLTLSPERQTVWDDLNTCNQLMAQLAEREDYLTFIDCTSILWDENGESKSDIYRSDNLHFNAKGYELWTTVIRPVLLEDLLEGGNQ